MGEKKPDCISHECCWLARLMAGSRSLLLLVQGSLFVEATAIEDPETSGANRSSRRER